MRRWLSRWIDMDAPQRSQVIAALKALPAIPEADRMRAKPMQRAKVQTLTEWKRRYA